MKRSVSPGAERSFARDALSVLSSRGVRIGMTFLGGLIIARELGPEGKGVLVALAIYPTLITELANLGIRQAATYY